MGKKYCLKVSVGPFFKTQNKRPHGVVRPIKNRRFLKRLKSAILDQSFSLFVVKAENRLGHGFERCLNREAIYGLKVPLGAF